MDVEEGDGDNYQIGKCGYVGYCDIGLKDP